MSWSDTEKDERKKDDYYEYHESREECKRIADERKQGTSNYPDRRDKD